MTDEPVGQRIQRGAAAAFAALVARHRQAVYRIAVNMCGSAGSAGEVTHQAFLSAWHELASGAVPAGFANRLYGIAMQAALAERKRAGVRPAVSLETFLPRFDSDAQLGSSRRDELAMVDPRRLTGVLREALDCMDDDVRAAYVLCDLVDVPAEDAAGILRASPRAIRERVHRARLMLGGFLDRLRAA